MNVDIANFFTQIDFTNPSWDLFIVLFFIIGVFLYGFSLGRDRIIVILVSIYISLAVVDNLPLIKNQLNLSLGSEFAYKLTSFFVLFLVLFFLFARSGLIKTIAAKDHSGQWWQVIVFSVLHVGLIISIAMSFLPAEYLTNFSEQTRAVFVSETGRFVWLMLPVIAMAMVRKKPDEKKK